MLPKNKTMQVGAVNKGREERRDGLGCCGMEDSRLEGRERGEPEGERDIESGVGRVTRVIVMLLMVIVVDNIKSGDGGGGSGDSNDSGNSGGGDDEGGSDAVDCGSGDGWRWQ